MKHLRNNLTAISLLLGIATQTGAQNLSLYEENIDIVAGRSASIAVKLNNAKLDAYNALTLSLQIPEGFSLAGNPSITDKWENPICITQDNLVLPDSASLSQYESIMFYALGDMDEERNIKMAFASASELPGSSIDSLLTFRLQVSPDANLRTHVVKLQNILFEYDSVKQDRLEDANIRVRVCTLGDANHDNKVRMDDATLVINHILNRESGIDYNAMMADMDDDGCIDIFDIMKLVNVIVNGKMPVADEARIHAAAPHYEDLSLAFTRNGITVGVPNVQRFTSFQFDIETTEDVELKNVRLLDTNTNHMIQFAKTDNNHFRVIGLSLDNSTFTNNGEDVLAFELPNCGRIRVFNTMFVDPRGLATYFLDKEIESGITGIRNIKTSDDESVYDILGRKVKNENRNLHKGIYIINNKRVVVK